MSEEIKESVDKIRSECDTIEENLDEKEEEDEDKKGKTRGDPVVTLY